MILAHPPIRPLGRRFSRCVPTPDPGPASVLRLNRLYATAHREPRRLWVAHERASSPALALGVFRKPDRKRSGPEPPPPAAPRGVLQSHRPFAMAGTATATNPGRPRH